MREKKLGNNFKGLAFAIYALSAGGTLVTERPQGAMPSHSKAWLPPRSVFGPWNPNKRPKRKGGQPVLARRPSGARFARRGPER